MTFPASTAVGEKLSLSYRPITPYNVARLPQWRLMSREHREAVEVVSQVLPFRTNRYVVDQLIDWSDIPGDPIYQLTFPQPGMLEEEDYRTVRQLLRRRAPRGEVEQAVAEIRWKLNPHPSGQLTHYVPRWRGEPLPGLQHKYRETVLFFPAQGQACHAYCTYCFRWAQFVDMPEIKFKASQADGLAGYLRAHPEVSDVLLTGGDPLIMKTRLLRRCLEPLLEEELEHVRNIRIGTKAPAYWPQRFLSDEDADDLLRLFQTITESGLHLSIMTHYSHPVEMSTREARQAVRRIRSTGAEIRMQAPLIRHVNDDPQAWAEMWSQGVTLGMVPYYLFVERDTGAKGYFELPLARAYEIFRQAYSGVSGLARTVRGPVMSAFPGKVRVVGIERLDDQKVFVLELLQARQPSWVRRPFFARFCPRATWFDQLEPAFGESFFFEENFKEESDLVGKTIPIDAVLG